MAPTTGVKALDLYLGADMLDMDAGYAENAVTTVVCPWFVGRSLMARAAMWNNVQATSSKDMVDLTKEIDHGIRQGHPLIVAGGWDKSIMATNTLHKFLGVWCSHSIVNGLNCDRRHTKTSVVFFTDSLTQTLRYHSKMIVQIETKDTTAKVRLTKNSVSSLNQDIVEIPLRDILFDGDMVSLDIEYHFRKGLSCYDTTYTLICHYCDFVRTYDVLKDAQQEEVRHRKRFCTGLWTLLKEDW